MNAKKTNRRTRQGIFEALICLLDEMPYEKINICTISEKAGVARQSFYRNFKSKDDVIISYISELFSDLKVMGSRFEKERLPEIYTALFNTMKENKSKLSKIINSKLELLILEPLEKLNMYLLEKFYAKENALEAQDYNYMVRYQTGGVLNVILGWLKYDMPESAESMAQMVTELLKSLSVQSADYTGSYLPA